MMRVHGPNRGGGDNTRSRSRRWPGKVGLMEEGQAERRRVLEHVQVRLWASLRHLRTRCSQGSVIKVQRVGAGQTCSELCEQRRRA